jgi:hypothetical protein
LAKLGNTTGDEIDEMVEYLEDTKNLREDFKKALCSKPKVPSSG